ncbi:MAG: DUF3574 domain-containing protein [Tahibacter sp.]
MRHFRIADFRTFAILAAAAFLCSACAVEWKREFALQCRLDEKIALRDALYFGRNIPGGGTVTDADWEHFRDESVASAFPDGFTELNAVGHWRNSAGVRVAEATRIVLVVHTDDGVSEQALDRIVTTYRERFRQESVLRERSRVCVRF